MQDLAYLENQGATADKLRAKFEAEVPSDKIKRLMELHSSRISDGVTTSIREAPIYGAIDRLLETSQNQVPYIQARELASSGKSHEEVLAAFRAFKLDRMLVPAINPETGEEIKVNGQPTMTFNQPLFDSVMVPLAASYADIRANKLFLDRNLVPRYKYSPPRLTAKDLLVTEIVTSRIQRMTQEMGYADDDLQSIKSMVYYGACWTFPRERYYREEFTTRVDGTPTKKTNRSGVRFISPHPRRTFYDRAYPAYTFNTDTGVSYAGYWDILPYREIKDNPAYWNREKVSYGSYAWFSGSAWNMAQTFYPCVVEYPTNYSQLALGSNWDSKAGQTYLSVDELDASVPVVALFHKLVPKDWDLFDYDQPVWMRFIYAGSDTVIHAEVLPYTPGYVMLDRYDANRAVPNSLALSLLPFQQLLGNFLTQHFASVRQNLIRLVWLNTDSVDSKTVGIIKSLKDKLFQGVQFLTYSRRQQIGLQSDVKDAATRMDWPQVDTQQIDANLRLTLMAVERILGFSPQEVGAAASHEQSATEISVTSNATSVNVEAMGYGVDRGVSAKKRLLYEAMVAFDDDEVFAEVTDMTPERKAALEKLGFAIEAPGEPGMKFGVKGRKAALVIDSFVSEKEGVNRLNDSKVGIAMLQSLGQVAGNPVLFQTVGPVPFLELFNYVWKMIGLPDDFRLRPQPTPEGGPEAQQQQFLRVLQQAKDAIVQEAVQVVGQQVKEQVAAPISEQFQKAAQALQQLAGKNQQQDEAIAQLIQAMQGLGQHEAQQQQAIGELQQAVTVMAAALQPPPQPVVVDAPVPPQALQPPGPGQPVPGLV